MSIAQKMIDIQENMTNVYGRAYTGGHLAGYGKGKAEGLEEGFENGFQGGKAMGVQEGILQEREKFWKYNQQEGKRENYQYAYIGYGFDFDNFYPHYDIRPTKAATAMFFHWTDRGKHRGSLKERLQQCNVTLDTSQATDLQQIFYNCNFTELPAIVLPGGVNNRYIFAMNPYLVTVESVTVSENTAFNGCFTEVPALENIQFRGVIAQNGLDLSGSPNLTPMSLWSLLACLKDLKGGSKTVTIGSANIAKLTQQEIQDAKAKGWTIA